MYYSYTTNEENIVDPTNIIKSVQNSHTPVMLTLCMTIDNNDNITPIIVISKETNTNNYFDESKYILPDHYTVIQEFKNYFKDYHGHIKDYYCNGKYHYLLTFSNNDKIVRQLEKLLDPVSVLLETKKKLIID